MTDIINRLPDNDQEIFVRDYLSELDNITNNKPHEVIAQLNATQLLLVDVEDQLRKSKHHYEVEFIKLCTSEEYQQYKTIKQREQMATSELAEEQMSIDNLKAKRDILRANRTGLEYELRFLLKQEGV